MYIYPLSIYQNNAKQITMYKNVETYLKLKNKKKKH